MSSRQEEKDRRRAEREAAEAAAAHKAATKGRLQLALGALVALAAIAVAVLVLGKGSGDAKKLAGDGDLPALKQTNLLIAAKDAGCTVKTWPSEGRDHTTDPAKWIYKTNPPTSGPHNPVAAEDGLYDPGNEPAKGLTTHSLEHGRIDIQYRPGTPAAVRGKLEALGSEALEFGKAGYHVLVFENQTRMKAAVAATAWTQSLTCPKMNDAVYDAVRDFRTEYTDKGPELIP